MMEEQELESLMVSTTAAPTPTSTPTTMNKPYTKQKIMILVLAGIFSLVVVSSYVRTFSAPSASASTSASASASAPSANQSLLFTCQSQIKKPENDKLDFTAWYDNKKTKELHGENGGKETKSNNKEEEEEIEEEEEEEEGEGEGEGEGESESERNVSIYPTKMTQRDINQLKKNNYDGSTWSYNEFRPDMYKWKSRYAKLLKSGDVIFESACGIGMNLLMTVDILNENANIQNLNVNGIEYRASSTADANNLLPQLLPQTGNAELGTPICRADATDLYFIPSNIFDLAFTGYIDPIVDPLDFRLTLGHEVEFEDLCTEDGIPNEKGREDQAAVEDWYAKWVSELIRITKPGQVIGIEQVSYPKCANRYDWGGVEKLWWKDVAIEKYGWDVIEESIVIENIPSELNRYNVLMQKKKT